MIITPHAITGAAVAKDASSPSSAFFKGVASHFLLDKVPHVEYSLLAGKGTYLSADILAALTVLHLSKRHPYTYLGAFAGIFPDIIAIGTSSHEDNWFRKFHHWNHASSQPTNRSGIVTQIVAGSLAFYYLRRT